MGSKNCQTGLLLKPKLRKLQYKQCNVVTRNSFILSIFWNTLMGGRRGGGGVNFAFELRHEKTSFLHM